MRVLVPVPVFVALVTVVVGPKEYLWSTYVVFVEYLCKCRFVGGGICAGLQSFSQNT